MKTKNANPANFLSGQNTSPILFLYFQINHLKQIYRKGYRLRGITENFCESVADHTFGMATLAIFICEIYFPKLDLLKVIVMTIIHELGEIENGDITPHDGVSESVKYQLEHDSIQRLLKDFPGGEKYLEIWKEFERKETPEAKLVKQLDKLEMIFQSKIYKLQHGMNPQDFFKNAREEIRSPELLEILEEVERIS